MTKEPDKSNWEVNYNNKSLSGIEVRDKNGKLVNFITIRHDEILENKTTHRITIKLNENAEPMLPPPQTFEEIIQAKRRQQHLLYGSGNTSSNAILSDRTVRRVAAARQVAAASLSRRPIVNIARRNRPSSSRSKKRSKKKPKPAIDPQRVPEISATPPVQSKKGSPQVKVEPDCEEPIPSTSNSTSTNKVVTSMKDLDRVSLESSINPKEVKALLKSAPPGSQIILPNGTVIKKSRRGGARVGAGRKRSRPLPPGQQASFSRNSMHQSLSSNSSFSSSQA